LKVSWIFTRFRIITRKVSGGFMTNPPVIVISGASSGIGAATARLFGKEGYRVVLAARRLERLESLADEIRSDGGQALPVATDITKLEDIRTLVETSLNHYGKIDVLFNNAGFGRLDWLENLDPRKDIEALIRVNLLGVIQLTRAALPHMIERRSGQIINMASLAGLVATPTYTVYAASKFAIRGFSDALRREVGVWGIHVSVIYPGSVETEFTEHARINRRTGTITPKALRLKAEDVAQAVLSVSQHPRRAMVIPWIMRVGILMNNLFPGISDWVMEQRFTRPERGL
jgi:NADP-dependent 3-hydroxy acid dehydrogenase YdfG